MNPFDLYGPQFLLFFVLLSIGTLIVLRLLRPVVERRDPSAPPVQLNDPYKIALLRGGKQEMVRVAVVSLIDRRLLTADGAAIRTTPVAKASQVRRDVERTVIELCSGEDGARTYDVVVAYQFDSVVASYERELRDLQLLPDDTIQTRRMTLFLSAAALLILVAGTKIAIALLRGRTNIQLLIILTALVVFLAGKVVFRPRTVAGDAFLDEMKNLFQSLRLRAAQIHPGGATSEVAMLAAVFGLAVLPKDAFRWVKDLFPKAYASGTNGTSGSCGSSCGSSCGGGCGGGCGGCGS